MSTQEINPDLTFADFGFAEPITRAITEQGYIKPTPIQAQSMPHVLQGADVMGAAQTGTGKTAAFALPILHKLEKGNEDEIAKVRALIIVPTRELATQMTKAIRSYALGTNLRILNVFGGVKKILDYLIREKVTATF